jgi:hypothetical protein
MESALSLHGFFDDVLIGFAFALGFGIANAIFRLIGGGRVPQ